MADWPCVLARCLPQDRTLDFAAKDAEQLIDWYLALASMLPSSSEQLLNEEQLRARINGQMAR